MAGGMPWRCAEEAGGCGGRRRCVHVRRAAVGPRVECIDECSPSRSVLLVRTTLKLCCGNETRFCKGCLLRTGVA